MTWINTAALIVFIGFLETILSVDNAVVLAVLAQKLPHGQQKKALTYGLIGAFVFRLILLALVVQIVHWNWTKFIGGGYLLFLAGQQLLKKKQSRSHSPNAPQSFWKAVAVIEFTDLIFAFDSVLAAVAISDRYWVVFTGGAIGILAVRFSASGMIKVLERHPSLEKTGYYLVFVVGLKLIIDGLGLTNVDFQSPSNFAFWVLWLSMALVVIQGLIKVRK